MFIIFICYNYKENKKLYFENYAVLLYHPISFRNLMADQNYKKFIKKKIKIYKRIFKNSL